MCQWNIGSCMGRKSIYYQHNYNDECCIYKICIIISMELNALLLNTCICCIYCICCLDIDRELSTDRLNLILMLSANIAICYIYLFD